LLYATSARIGGSGLDSTSLQDILASSRGGFLGEAIGYANCQSEVPRAKIRSLALAPVRALSFLESQRYYAAKKCYVDRVAARRLATGNFDCFHGWSGDCLRSLLVARQRGIPALLNIPTWHRNKGKRKPFVTKSEREARTRRGWKAATAFRVSRQRVIAEYELADVILVPSRRSMQTFLDVGTPAEKLAYAGRGVDPERFRPAAPPPRFRLVFVGALIERKGVHYLLRAWKRLALPDAELLLVGTLHDEMKAHLQREASPGVRVAGFSPRVQDVLQTATAFVFPSECEGFAKATLEAAACGLPLIATAESGDAVVDGETGILVPAGDADALAGAIRHLHDHPELHGPMGAAARQRVLDHFTWDHYHQRLRSAYAYAMAARAAPALGAI
jgi:glycosyltransferase involved in cell wall biosynthesis